MKGRLVYVELKTGFSDNGPAWIGIGRFSKTGRTIYFDGKALVKAIGNSGNFLDLESRDEYWVSGVKKDGKDRHHSGAGKIRIDNPAVGEYLRLLNFRELPKFRFEVVNLVSFSAEVSTLQNI